LQELILTETYICTIPTEILLGCKRLKVLNLSYTKSLLHLPDGIANLSELQELYLRSSAVRSLPHQSVWIKLKSLKVLDLSSTCNLETMRTNSLPSDGMTTMDEKMASLCKLNLRHSAVVTKHSSSSSRNLWDNLILPCFLSSKTLVDLDLGGLKYTMNLEEIVPRTSMLERLDLSSTDFAALPPVSSAIYNNLHRIKVLSLTSTPVLRKYPQQQKAAMTRGTNEPPLQTIPLKNHLSRLGCIGLRAYQTQGFASHRKLRHILALNRARYRLLSLWHPNPVSESITKAECTSTSNHYRFPVALWPILLSSKALFQPYEECIDKSCDCQRLIGKNDAMFHLLVNFGNEIFGRGPEKEEEKKDDFVFVSGNTSDQEEWTLL